MKKIIISHAILFVLIIGIGIFSYLKYWNVAVVNGQPISRLQFIQALEKQGGKQVLGQLVDEAIILHEGNLKNVKIDQKTIDGEITKIEDRLKGQGQTIDAALAASSMTRSDLEFQIRLNKIQDILSAPPANISPAEINEFLKANKDMLPTGKTPEELNTLAKEQLVLQASQASASAWLNSLRQSAKIIYK